MSMPTTQCIFCPQLPLGFQVKVSFCLPVLKIPSMGVEICYQYISSIFSSECLICHCHNHN